MRAKLPVDRNRQIIGDPISCDSPERAGVSYIEVDRAVYYAYLRTIEYEWVEATRTAKGYHEEVSRPTRYVNAAASGIRTTKPTVSVGRTISARER